MKLPHRESAYIPPPKLNEYLLSEVHSVGKAKAKFFRSYGFNETNTDVLEQRLLAIAQSEDVIDVVRTTHGTKYVIDGSLQTISGETLYVRTIWIIEDQNHPRFVTAYPA
ncbi:hypothetical protein ANRL2_01210 [Anaerolineae bacterium]|nr:hypothetical protein ANRL2_01210 [Anaerolineae bacterium]